MLFKRAPGEVNNQNNNQNWPLQFKVFKDFI